MTRAATLSNSATMLTAWADTEIWTIADVKRVIGDSPDMVEDSSNPIHLNAVIQDAIDAVKRSIRRKLLIELPGKFVNFPGVDWADESNPVVISYRTTDTMLDKISNPSELFDAGVYLTIAKLYERAATHLRFDDTDANRELLNKAKYWNDLGTTALTDSLLLLSFDWNENYVAEDSERVTRRRLPRFVRG